MRPINKHFVCVYLELSISDGSLSGINCWSKSIDFSIYDENKTEITVQN